METVTNYANWSMDDIVFDNRNKDYGAYQLRQATKKNVRTGIILVSFAITAFILLTAFDWGFSKPKTDKPIEVVANTTVIPPDIPPPALITPPPPPPPTRPTIRFVEMVVRKQQQIHEDETPPLITKNDSDIISDKTVEGDHNGISKIIDEPPVESSAPVASEQPFMFVEQPPEFPGGEEALLKFISDNCTYSQMERDNDIQGRVLLRFVVMEDGSVADVNVLRGVSPGLDKEAVRVTKMLPKFKPGKQQGKAVRVYFNLPVVFRLK